MVALAQAATRAGIAAKGSVGPEASAAAALLGAPPRPPPPAPRGLCSAASLRGGASWAVAVAAVRRACGQPGGAARAGGGAGSVAGRARGWRRGGGGGGGRGRGGCGVRRRRGRAKGGTARFSAHIVPHRRGPCHFWRFVGLMRLHSRAPRLPRRCGRVGGLFSCWSCGRSCC